VYDDNPGDGGEEYNGNELDINDDDESTVVFTASCFSGEL
jgi:hypothetical protein